MPDNVTFQTTVATPPNATVVRTKDRSGVETQLMGLDVNPGGSAELLMQSQDNNLPATLLDLAAVLRSLLSSQSAHPSFDGFDRRTVFMNGGALGLVTTVSTVSAITNGGPAGAPAGGFLAFPMFAQLAGGNWSDIRARVS